MRPRYVYWPTGAPVPGEFATTHDPRLSRLFTWMLGVGLIRLTGVEEES